MDRNFVYINVGQANLNEFFRFFTSYIFAFYALEVYMIVVMVVLITLLTADGVISFVVFLKRSMDDALFFEAFKGSIQSNSITVVHLFLNGRVGHGRSVLL
nr:hypothetical protein [Portibacter marinus]